MSAAEGEFIFDAVGGFLTSPIWNSPVRTFIEQNSLVFDPDGENHEAFQNIHKEYKKMVDTLLSSFLKDVGITEEQFMKACQKGSSSPQFSSINREVFDQLWAAEDFEVFKRLMTQKNIELQLQALQLLQQIHNVQMPLPVTMQNQMPMPVPMAPPSSVPQNQNTDEDAIMQEVLRRSKEEFEAKHKDAKAKTEQEFERTLAESAEESKRLAEKAKREQEELEKALQSSLEAQKKQTAEAEKLRDEVKKSPPKGSPQPTPAETKPSSKPSPAENKAASPAPSKTTARPSPVKSKPPTQPNSQTSGLPPLSVQTKRADTPATAAEGWLKSAKEDAAKNTSVTPTQSKEVSEEEMKRRAAYLKQQRDKLMDLKRQEREKNLAKYTEQQPKARPTSSRAARRVTAGEQVASSAAKSDEDEGKKLAMRRALADVLKREVVDKN